MEYKEEQINGNTRTTITTASGMYITQAHLDDEQQRMFVREKVSYGQLNRDDYRDATEQEKTEWESQYQKDPTDYEEEELQ